MQVLIIATSAKPRNAEEEISTGKRPRLEYVELGKEIQSAYVDYNPVTLAYPPLIRRMEEHFKLDMYWAKQLARKIRKEKFDVVLSMSERIGIPLAYFLNGKVKHIVILHHPLSPNKLRLVKILHTQRRWHRILPLSDAETEVLRSQLHVGAGQIETVHYAIDTDFYQNSIPKDSGDRGDFVLSLGLSNRDYPTLIEAMRGLPDIRGQISGTSAWVNHGAGYEQLNLPPNIQVKNYNHPSVIREAYARSRFVVIPLDASTTQWSAGSASVLQPQAMGKPVIATRIPGIPDYVRDGETGILVNGKDPRAMAEAIRYLWDHPERAEEMGRCACDWVRKNYSYERWVKDIRRILES